MFWLLIFHFIIPFVSTLFRPSPVTPIKLIIDTDGVYDDIRGLSIALTHPNVEVIGITTVHGGVSANQSAANVARLLRAIGKESVPIFIGSQDSLVPKGPVVVWEELFGSDGIGGVPDIHPKSLPSDFQMAQKQNAIDAIIELTKNTSDVVLIGLGPLTNIAMALRKDPEVAKRIRKVIIMGGNYLGIGNSQYNSTAEFNLLMDPEAAHIVLSSIHLTTIPWDMCFLKGPEYNNEVDYEESLRQKTDLSYFLSNITARGRQYNKLTQQLYAFVDDIAVAVAIDSNVAKKCLKLCASVELERAAVTRGQVTVDWLSTKYIPIEHSYQSSGDKNEANWLSHTFITEYDAKKVNEMLIAAVKSSGNTNNIDNNSLIVA